MKIEEVSENTNVPSTTAPSTDFVLSKENCVNFLIKSIEDLVRPTLTLQEAEIVNRGVRFFKKLKQFTPEAEKEMDETKATELLLSAVSVGQARKAYDLDNASVVFYCYAYLKNELDKNKEKGKSALETIPE